MGLARRKRKDTVLPSVELIGKDLLIFFFKKHVHVCISVCWHMRAMSCVCMCGGQKTVLKIGSCLSCYLTWVQLFLCMCQPRDPCASGTLLCLFTLDPSGHRNSAITDPHPSFGFSWVLGILTLVLSPTQQVL